jgi:hypothetical protein
MASCLYARLSGKTRGFRFDGILLRETRAFGHNAAMTLNGKIRAIPSPILCAVLLCSCATAPKHHSYRDTGGLTIGKTTPAECRELFGQPRETRDETSAGGSFEIFRYVELADRNAQGNARTLVVEFKNGVLNGFASASSFAEDRSTFPVTNVAKIKFAKSTKAEVEQLLGKPDGKVRCPTKLFRDRDSETDGLEAWIYHELQPVPLFGPKRGKRTYIGATCAVVFDVDGLVTDIAQSSVH